jgi:hypothetical protein
MITRTALIDKEWRWGKKRRRQTRLEPRLAAEEQRRLFDIHAYGEEVIGRVLEASTRAPGRPVAFAAAVRGLSVHDIGRSFLATLQLANDGNVEISLQGCAGAMLTWRDSDKLALARRGQACAGASLSIDARRPEPWTWRSRSKAVLVR